MSRYRPGLAAPCESSRRCGAVTMFTWIGYDGDMMASSDGVSLLASERRKRSLDITMIAACSEPGCMKRDTKVNKVKCSRGTVPCK